MARNSLSTPLIVTGGQRCMSGSAVSRNRWAGEGQDQDRRPHLYLMAAHAIPVRRCAELIEALTGARPW
jgi:hypothetical protein